MNLFKNKFILTLIISAILSTINFFLTPNPYSAYHSGRTALDSIYVSNSFFIPINYIIFITLIIVIIVVIIEKNGKIKIYRPVIYLLFFSTISLIITHSIFITFQQYFFNIITILSTALLVSNDNSNILESNYLISKLWIILSILFIFGLIIAILGYNRYGLITLSFSRTIRGEITYWNVIGFISLFISISFILYEKTKKIIYLLPPIINLFVHLATYSRMETIKAVIPFVIYFFLRIKGKRKYFIYLLIIILAPFLIQISYNFITLYGVSTSYWTTNKVTLLFSSRNILWKHYINGFLEHPIWGTGLNYQLSSSYTGIAVSEISILKWFTEQGVFTGGTLLFIMIRAFKKALHFLQNKLSNNYELVMAYIFCINFISTLLEANSRILSFYSFAVWYAMFYLYTCESKS